MSSVVPALIRSRYSVDMALVLRALSEGFQVLVLSLWWLCLRIALADSFLGMFLANL